MLELIDLGLAAFLLWCALAIPPIAAYALRALGIGVAIRMAGVSPALLILLQLGGGG